MFGCARHSRGVAAGSGPRGERCDVPCGADVQARLCAEGRRDQPVAQLQRHLVERSVTAQVRLGQGPQHARGAGVHIVVGQRLRHRPTQPCQPCYDQPVNHPRSLPQVTAASGSWRLVGWTLWWCRTTQAGWPRSRRVGQWVSVAGTTAAAEGGGAVGGDDIGKQAREALRRIRLALEQAGARLQDVVRTRMFVTDISRWQEVGRAHDEVFADIRPAASMVEVSRLIDPALHVEIEADAVVQ